MGADRDVAVTAPGKPAAEGSRSSLSSRIVVPIVLPVVVAILVAMFTPVGTKLQRWLFPSTSTVRGVVKLYDKPAAAAEIELDGKVREPTDSGGSFLLEKVGEGRHELTVRARGAKELTQQIVVKRNEEDTLLDDIVLEPALAVEADGQGGFDPFGAGGVPSGPPTVRYNVDMLLWLSGDPDVLSHVKSVTYTAPSRLQPRPAVVGNRASAFCHRLKGSIELNFGESFNGTINVQVTFDDGATLGLPLPEQLSTAPRPAACS